MICRGGNDLYTLDWSPDSTQLLAGSFDGVVYIWHLTRQVGQRYNEIRDHWTLVQGVCYDPLGSMIVSLSADRSARIYKKSKKGNKLYCAHHLKLRVTDIELEGKVASTNLLGETSHPDEEPNRYFQHKYFHDDSAPTFFRRPAWSPEGKLLLLPCGRMLESPTAKTPVNVTWIFTRGNCAKPSGYIPSTEISVVASFSPVLYQRTSTLTSTSPTSLSVPGTSSENPNGMDGIEASPTVAAAVESEPIFDLAYKMVYAIATLTGVFIYDTEHTHPIVVFKDGHYDRLTDLAWRHDGKVLAISSSDGYVTLITFDDNELGTVLDQETFDKVMQPAMEARIPKPKIPRKPKVTAASGGTSTSANNDSQTAATASAGENAMQGVESTEGAKPDINSSAAPGPDDGDNDEEEDSSDEMDQTDAHEGTIVNFEEESFAVPETAAPTTPVVRKQGRRVVATLINPDGTAIATQPTAPTPQE